MNTLAGEEFQNFIDKQWKIHWIKNKEKSYIKIKTLEEKQVKKLENSTKSTTKKNDKKPSEKGLDNLANSVKYKDKDIAGIKYDNKPRNLGFAGMSKNMEKVLGKHPGYTVYKKIKEDDIELSVEECIQKGRWKNLDEQKEKSEEPPNKEIYDQKEKIINFKNIRATELNSNKRVNIVNNGDLQFETKSENLKMEIMKTVRKYINENENVKYSNLPVDEREGLEECETFVNEGKAVIFETDKSKKFSINTQDNYVIDMKPYVENDKIVDRKFVNKITRMFIETSKNFVTILRIGENVGHFSRILKNVHVAEESEIPVKSGMFKDHKKGKKYRPMVNGNIGPIANVSEIISLVLKSYMQELQEKVGMDNIIQSTEELLSVVEKYNKNVESVDIEDKRDIFIASMDVDSLYPSMKSEPTAEAIREIVRESDIEIADLNIKELLIFLRKNMTNEEISQCKLGDYIPTKDKKAKDQKKSIHKYDLWNFPEVRPAKSVMRKLAIECKQIMNNHVYELLSPKLSPNSC